MPIEILHPDELSRFHREHFAKNRPAIIRGLRDLAPRRIFQWSAESLAREVGDKVVPVMATRTGFLSYERNFIQMPFSDFVARMREPDPESGKRLYYKNPVAVIGEHLDDSDDIDALRRYTRKAVARNVWISSSGLTIGLHFDPADNLNFQLVGHKSFTLYPPGIDPYYPLPMFSQTAHISGVFRRGPDPDLSQYPRFQPERGTIVDLRAGDVLYIPAYWWHQVESLGEENLNLNLWWLPRLDKQLRNWNQALRGHAQVLSRLLRYGNIQKAPADER